MKQQTMSLKVLVTGFVAAAVLAACAPGRSVAPAQTAAPASATEDAAAPAGDGKRVRIEVWFNITNEADLAAYQVAFDKFNASQNRIEAVMVKGRGNDALLTAISGGKPPDIYWTWDGSEPIGTWANNGLLRPLDDFVARDKIDLTKYVPALNKIGVYEGKRYGVPWQFDSLLLFYNRKHFEEAGLDPDKPPKTIDELFEYGKKLTKTDPNGNITRIGFMPPNWNMLWYSWFNMYDGKLYDEASGKFTADDPGVLQAMRDIQKAWSLYGDPAKVDKFAAGLGNGLSPDDPFLKGLVSMELDGDWRMGYEVRYTQQQYGKDFGIATIPYPAGKPEKEGASHIFGMNQLMPHNNAHPDEAWEVMKFFLQEDTDVLVAKGMWNLPANISALSHTDLQAMPGFAVALNNVIKNSAKFSYLPVTPATGQLADAIAQQMDLVMHGKLTPEEAAKKINETAQQALDAAKKK